MNEQKITPKKSEAGIEYIREMRLAGLIKRDIIPADEAVGYEELEKNGSLPDGVYATYENGKRSYCRVESTVPDMTGEEIDRLIQLRKASDLRTIPHYKELDIILWRDGRHRTLPRRDFSVRALIKP